MGTVIGKDNMRVLEGAQVFLNKSSVSAKTDSDGVFALVDLPTGYWELIIISKGYEVFRSNMLIEFGKSYKLNIELKPTSRPGKVLRWKKAEEPKELLNNLLMQFSGCEGYCESEDLQNIEFRKQNDKLYAYSDGSVKISNTMTGIDTYYYFSGFEVSRDKNLDNTVKYWFNFYPVNDQEQLLAYDGNRSLFYEGTKRHFYRTLLIGNPEEAGYFLYDSLGNNVEIEVDIDDMLDNGYLPIDFSQVYKVKYMPVRYVPDLYNIPKYKVGIRETDIDNKWVNRYGLSINENLKFTDLFLDKNPGALPLNYIPESPSHLKNDISWLQEKVYVHTNKDYYYPGEYIFFKAYMQYTDSAYIEFLSKSLYVDLLDDNGNVLNRNRIKIENGRAVGSLLIPDSLSMGTFQLNAYTNWMKNFDEGYYASSIPILARNYNFKSDYEKATIDRDSLQIITDRKKYSANDKVKVKLRLLNQDKEPLTASLSVSITDHEKVKKLDFPKIYDQSEFSRKIYRPDSIIANIERGVVSTAKLKNMRGEGIQVSVFNPDMMIYDSLETNRNSIVRLPAIDSDSAVNLSVSGNHYGVDFTPDLEEVFISELDVKVPPISLERLITEQNFLKSESSVDPDTLNSINYYNEDGTSKYYEKDELDEEEKDPRRLPGKAGYIDKSQLNSTGGDLFIALQGKIPGLIMSASPPRQIFFRRALNSSFSSSQSPMVLIDGSPVGGSAAQTISSIDPANVEGIEYVSNMSATSRYGTYGNSGIINILLGPGNDEDNPDNMKLGNFLAPGYDTAVDFEETVLNENFPSSSQSSELYWNADLSISNENGTVEFVFQAPQKAGSYRIDVKGLSEKNKVVSGIYLFEVVDQ
jgi:hypothetical protein